MASVTTPPILLQEVILTGGTYNFVSNTATVTFTEETTDDLAAEQTLLDALYASTNTAPPVPTLTNASLFGDTDPNVQPSVQGDEYLTAIIGSTPVNFNYEYLGAAEFPVDFAGGGSGVDVFAIIEVQGIANNRTLFAVNLTNAGDPANGNTGVGPDDLEPELLFITPGGIAPCFTAGSLILTDQGERPIETLVVGDLVLTVDRGLMAVKWIGRVKLTNEDLLKRPNLRPIRFRTDALGIGTPERDMLLSPQHRVLLSSCLSDLLFGESEVLAIAKSLINDSSIRIASDVTEVEYIHILFDTHQLVTVDGTVSESFHPGKETMCAMQESVNDEILAIFPDLGKDYDGYGALARPALSKYEAAALMAMEPF